MLWLEKSARVPENTALKGSELENLCNDRVNLPVYICGRSLFAAVHGYRYSQYQPPSGL